ncbi:hypothetical protein Ahy_B08g093250 [Arachis hypogaea]|uniref:Uncharacterized protein n=1 Tax=Arachis hypogaea TaxID=3818 RepID=A0A444Y5P3_ARAHY|nr:hypothetical protein Ahy_B08g093250 [Arachis hypogaea]
MASQTPQLHFVIFPFMAQGPMIPMMDIAKLLLQRNNVIVTIITTTQNTARFTSTFSCFIDSSYQIRLIQLQFPYQEAGLPEGCENLDMLHSLGNALSLFKRSARGPATFVNCSHQITINDDFNETIFEELSPPPSCIVSDMSLPYTIHIAKKFNIPKISFVGVSCYCLMCYEALHTSNMRESIKDETEYFVIPGLPDEIEVTKAQVPGSADDSWNKFYQEIHAAEADTYGIIMKSFQELEPEYERMYKKVRKDKVWCVSPVSLTNKDHLDKAQRGNKVSIEEWMHQKWLDSQKLNSVIRGGRQLERLEKWIKEDGFEERIKDQSLIIRDQFLNEKLVVKVLKVGVKVGAESSMVWGKEEEIGVLVKKEDIKIEIEKLMDENDADFEERRNRVRQLAEMAKRSVEEGSLKSQLTIVAPSSSLRSSRIVAASFFPALLSLSSPRRRCFSPLRGFTASPRCPCFSPVLLLLRCFYLAASASLSWLIVDCALLLLLRCIGRLWVVICGLSSVGCLFAAAASLHRPFVGCHL